MALFALLNILAKHYLPIKRALCKSNMKAILSITLDCIERENGEFDKSFDLVDLVVDEFGEDDLASKLYKEIEPSISWKVVADLYAILIWSTSDNGAKLKRTTDHWISECEDERKIMVALHLDTYPFIDGAEMVEKLEKVAKRFPSLSVRCNELIQSRSKLNA